jgi:K+/H+ antiporter YhaU regulatory subunit KhtT
MVFNPPGSVTLDKGDIMIALGEEEGLQQLGTDCGLA